jgi:hypothetical protein
MSPESRDLTIDTVLADPMIRALMKADHVNPRDFESLLRGKARQVSAPSRLPLAPVNLLACSARATSWRACFA